VTDVIIGPSTTKRADGGPGRATLAERLTRLYRTEIAIAAAIVAILVTVSFWSPYVLTWGNLANIAQASAPLILMSLGVFLVIATSGIDLSVGSTFSLTGMIGGLLLSSGLPWPVASLISLGVGIGVGAFNGGLVIFVGLARFVVTLITYAIGGSLAFVITNGHSIAIANPDFWRLNGGEILPELENFVFFSVLAVTTVELILRKLVVGRWIFAVGSNDKAARLLGIPVNGVRFSVYVASGLFASSSSLLSFPTSAIPKRRRARTLCFRRSPLASLEGPVCSEVQDQRLAPCSVPS